MDPMQGQLSVPDMPRVIEISYSCESAAFNIHRCSTFRALERCDA